MIVNRNKIKTIIYMDVEHNKNNNFEKDYNILKNISTCFGLVTISIIRIYSKFTREYILVKQFKNH